MITFETSDPNEARFARRIQFSGHASQFEMGGSVLKGIVTAVNEKRTDERKSWLVSVLPREHGLHLVRPLASRRRAVAIGE